MEEEFMKEQPVYEVQKVKIKNNQLTAEYYEKYIEANYKNSVTKSSEQFVHSDLLYAMSLLKTHVVAICEMREADGVNVEEPSENDLENRLKNIVVTGYSKGGSDDSAGVSIQAQKLLNSGRVLNLSVPFTAYANETGEDYPYGDALRQVINRLDYEVDAYLFGNKYGIKQDTFDFDTPDESDITGGEIPKKRGRKNIATVDIVADEVKMFDELA